MTDANGVTTTLTYDTLGRHKIAMDDPDMGQWSYQYDILGNLISQTDAKNQTVTQTYDLLGRMTERVEPEGTTTWIYDSAANGIGKLAEVSAPQGYSKTLTYDSLGRATSDTTTASWLTTTTSTEYDSFSRVSKETRPRGLVVENIYNDQGYLKAVRTPEAQIGDYDALHLSQKWDEIQPQLEQELQEAQAQADQLGAQAAVYRARAKAHYQTAEQLRQEAPNKAFLEEDRKQTIETLQQSAATFNALATQLELKAAEYQQIADAILSMMPTDWQQSWFTHAKARYDNYARDAIQKIETAYQANLTAPLVWIPIQVGDITIFVKGKPGFSGRGAITTKEADHLQSIAEWEAGTAQLLRQLAVDARAQQQARDKFNDAVINQPDLVWVPIDVDGITTFVQAIPGTLTPATVLTEEELDAYNAPDYLEADGAALAEYYTQQVETQQTRQRQIESWRNDYARTASRLSQNSVAYSTMVSLLQGGTGDITFWRATGRDAAGRLTASIVGNGLETQKHYDQATGQLMNIVSGFGSAPVTRHLEYQYDELNNVTSRIDHIQGLSEDFQYDRMDRLTQSYVSGQIGDIAYDSTVDYSYDDQGNILNKSDVGDYLYGDQNRASDNAGPHALLSAGANHTGYQYDKNGNMTSGGGRTIQWTSFNKPKKFIKGDTTVQFNYGPDRKRTRKAAGTTRTHYVSNLYERVRTDNKIEHKHFIYADGQLVAMHIKSQEWDTWAKLPDSTRYLHRDALGSIDTITDGQSNIVERMSYEPFGARRGGDWRADTGLPIIPAYTNRGFTGHEHVDEMDLIHMNGRVYDPTLGRFLSADPHVQSPYNSQSYNRYSYVLNNPLKYTDPSGYFIKSLFRAIKRVLKNPIVRAVVAIAAAYFGGLAVLKAIGYSGYASAATFASLGASKAIGSLALAGAVGGAVGGFVGSGGNLKAAIIGGVTGGLAGFIGASSAFGAVGKITAERVIAHGVVGGVASEARGGKFIKGFMSSAFTKSVSGRIQTVTNSNPIAGGVMAAVVGGTASRLAGGKFANGGMTAGFQYLFNQVASSLNKSLQASIGRLASGSDRFREIFSKLHNAERLWIIKLGNKLRDWEVRVGKTSLESGSFFEGLMGKEATGLVVIDTTDFGKFELVAENGSGIALTIDRVLAHEVAHAYLIQTEGVIKAGTNTYKLEATIIENEVMSQMDGNAQMRSLDNNGHTSRTLH